MSAVLLLLGFVCGDIFIFVHIVISFGECIAGLSKRGNGLDGFCGVLAVLMLFFFEMANNSCSGHRGR